MEWCEVQQGDGGGKEAGREPTGSGLNASVSPPGWVGGVLDDAARSAHTALMVIVSDGREPCASDALSGLHHTVTQLVGTLSKVLQ